MNLNSVNLSQLKKGEYARIVALTFAGISAFRQRLLALGLIPGTLVKVERVAPFGGSMAIKLAVAGLSFSIRKCDLIGIQVERVLV